jgi:hypothetical protein
VIIRYEQARVLLDREALAAVTGRSPNTIRARLKPTLRDEKSGRPLYIYDEAAAQLREIPTRRRTENDQAVDTEQ